MRARDPIFYALKHAARLVEGTSPTHDRLQRRLEAFAAACGFTELFVFRNVRPDVLRTDGRLLFVGDAKVAENERPTTEASAERISSYVKKLQFELLWRRFAGGLLCIATDEEDAAHEWQAFLEACCVARGLNVVDSQVMKSTANTWVACLVCGQP